MVLVQAHFSICVPFIFLLRRHWFRSIRFFTFRSISVHFFSCQYYRNEELFKKQEIDLILWRALSTATCIFAAKYKAIEFDHIKLFFINLVVLALIFLKIPVYPIIWFCWQDVISGTSDFRNLIHHFVNCSWWKASMSPSHQATLLIQFHLLEPSPIRLVLKSHMFVLNRYPSGTKKF